MYTPVNYNLSTLKEELEFLIDRPFSDFEHDRFYDICKEVDEGLKAINGIDYHAEIMSRMQLRFGFVYMVPSK